MVGNNNTEPTPRTAAGGKADGTNYTHKHINSRVPTVP